jgi:hypothetical protein
VVLLVLWLNIEVFMPVTADGFPALSVSSLRQRANILYEIDGQPALDLYKKYLGEI